MIGIEVDFEADFVFKEIPPSWTRYNGFIFVVCGNSRAYHYAYNELPITALGGLWEADAFYLPERSIKVLVERIDADGFTMGFRI